MPDFLRERPWLVAGVAGAIVAIIIAAWLNAPEPVAPRHAAPDDPSVALQHLPAGAPVPETPIAVLPADDPSNGCGPAPSQERVEDAMVENMEAADAALDRLAADLLSRRVDRDRALGLYLQMVALGGPRPWADNRARENLGELVRLATTTPDASAYALALYSCLPLGASAYQECGLLSYEQWARLEPDNAVPWLYLASDAERHQDGRGIEAALMKAAKASYSDAHLDQVSGLFASELTAALAPAVQSDLAGSLYSIQGGLPNPPLSSLSRYCGKEMQLYPDRLQTCGDLAANLIEHGRTAIEVLAASRVAERIGWADLRLARLRDQADALRWQASSSGGAGQYIAMPGCDSLKRLRSFMIARGQVGEVRQLREALAADGLSIAEAAKRFRSAKRR